MKQIPVGTCVPGDYFEKMGAAYMDKGFDCFAVNFHMSFGDCPLEDFGKQAREMAGSNGKFISTLGLYCNPLLFEEHEKNFHRVIDAAECFGTNHVSTFAGALTGESVDAAMPKFKEVFTRLTKHAEDKGVTIAIENCPMGGTWEHTTDNIGFNPRAWDMMFNEVPSDSLGLEWEATHQMFQLIEPIENLRKYVKKVFHLHGKDATIRWDEIRKTGFPSNATPVESRFPGFGDTDWRKVFAILQQNGYEGTVDIESFHDEVFGGDWETTGELHSLNYLKWCRGGDFVPNPW